MFSPESPLFTLSLLLFRIPCTAFATWTQYCSLQPRAAVSRPTGTPPFLLDTAHIATPDRYRHWQAMALWEALPRSTNHYLYCDLYLDAYFSHFIVHLRIIPSDPFLNFIFPVRSEPHNCVFACPHDKQRHHLACRTAFDDTQEQQ
jgi:hypothetical protein